MSLKVMKNRKSTYLFEDQWVYVYKVIENNVVLKNSEL